MMVFPNFNFSKRAIFVLSFLVFSLFATAQRKMETLDRGLVAVKADNGVFLSWRIYGTEWYNVTYNVYRDGLQLNSEPLKVSNFSDASGTLSSSYSVSALVDGVEHPECAPISPLSKQYKEIVLKSRNTSDYEINDATAADLDGDGQYEIIVKRINGDYSTAATNFAYFEAYKLDGTLMWEINVGPNIMSSSSVEINIAAFDFDEDGKAEVFMRTSEGTIFGDGTEIGDTDGDGITNYRYSVNQGANMSYMQAGPEFLSLIDGETGAEIDRVDFIPRINSGWWWPGSESKAYGHRANKFFFGAPYLDGIHPSLFIGRGIYTKTVMRTYDVVNKKLVLRWEFRATDTNDPYYGQGNHNYTIADVDEDGRDEIVWGSMTVDDNGKGLYSTNLGHGDALHVGDFDPYRKGTEIWKCLENSPVYGTVLYDGATGEILIHDKLDRDCGRSMAANVTDKYKGAELWGSNNCYSASTLQPVEAGGSVNYRIFWDGDLLDELLDHVNFSTTTGYGTGSISKFGYGNILVANGAISCNYTKGTPSLQADLFGDWREEVVWRNEANTAIRIYTTTDPTIYRNYTLMHDHQYRQAICWQMCGYNQPPHVSYFLGEGEGITVPPPPTMSNNKLVYTGNGDWNKSLNNWTLDGLSTNYADNSFVLLDVAAGNDVSLKLTETVSPKVLTVNSPGNYTLNAVDGKLSGEMILVKQGLGNFKLNGNHDFTGKTEIWNGSFILDGQLQNSPVCLGFFGKMYASGKLKEVTMRYGSLLNMGEEDSTGVLQINDEFTMEEGAIVSFDLYAPDSPKNDLLTIDGDFTFVNSITFQIKPHLKEGVAKLAAGNYLLATINGNLTGELDKVNIEGISGTLANLNVSEGKLYLEIVGVRSASSVVWNGNVNGAIWDLSTTKNFLNNGVSDLFVDQDQVTFNDNAASKTVNIGTEVTPSSIMVDATETYLFQGSGRISGDATLTKNGKGTLFLKNNNDFTGKVTINDGKILADRMPNAQAIGSIGAISSDPSNLELNGGTLVILNGGDCDRAISIGNNGGTIQNSSQLQWNEPIIGGVLTKSGAGELVLAGSNTHTKTILQSGTLKLLYDTSNPGKTISLEGGTLQCNDNNSYSTLSWNIEVPEGKTANIRLDSRAYYTGKLTGSGTLNVYIPYVRSDLNGDMSEFEGTLNCSPTGSSADLRINNSKGLPKAKVIVNANLYTYNDSGSSMILGALSGTGTLTGAESYQIGAKGIDSEFNGTITAGSLTKVGSGEFSLSNANTYTGSTSINAGALNANNTTGSATGTGSVRVNSGGTLTGKGYISGSVSVENGGTIAPGTSSVGNKLTINNSATFKSGSLLLVKANPLFKYIDQLVVTGKITLTGQLQITKSTTGDYADGDEYKLFDCANITGSFSSISPATPGEGLVWDVSELQSAGVIKVTKANAIFELNNGNVSIYPNPVSDYVYIDINNWISETAQVIVSDISGRIRLQTEISIGNQNRIDINALPNGVYFIKIEENKQLHNFRIIKQ